MKRFSYYIAVVALLSLALLQSKCLAREQYQMTQPPGPPPTAPIGSIGFQPGLATSVGTDFWKSGGGYLDNSVEAGTVMTGILQEDISSNKSKPGDVFSIVLPYGAQSNGKQIVPGSAKIVGVIQSVTPAKELRFGHPGSVEVSLQSLVLPDGRAVRFHGFIDYNANLDPRVQPKVRTAGPKFADYGMYAKSFLMQFPAGVGAAVNVRHRGADFSLTHGQSIPIRTTENISLPPAPAPPVGYRQSNISGMPGVSVYQQSLTPGAPPVAPSLGTVNQLSGTIPGQAYRQYAAPQVSGQTGPAGPELNRIAPAPAAPVPGYLPAAPQLRSELGAPASSVMTPSTQAQGIHATPLRLYDPLDTSTVEPPGTVPSTISDTSADTSTTAYQGPEFPPEVAPSPVP